MFLNFKKLVGQKPSWTRFVWLPLALPLQLPNFEARRGLPKLTGLTAAPAFVGDAYHG